MQSDEAQTATATGAGKAEAAGTSSDEVAAKPKRTRRRKKTDDEVAQSATPASSESEPLNAEPSEGGEVTQQEIIAASADTPAAQTPKRRRTSRKKAETEAQAETQAQAQTEVSQGIVTSDETTGQVSQRELAQIPVPASQDEP